MDMGGPVSYEVLEPGTPVFSSDDVQIGTVAHVLAVEDADLFEGIVISEHIGSGGHRWVDATDVAEIHERGVVLKLDRAASEQLHEPTANPAVIRDDPAAPPPGPLQRKLRRAWDLISGNY
jgi:hypothetical protein